jgi:hypothetical protein
LPINHSLLAIRSSLLAAPPHLPRSASQARDSRAIQSQASVIDLNSPISSIVPSSHSASTYQWLASAALISRGLKIGRGNLGMLVDTSAAARASTVVVALAKEVCGPATRHGANMIRVADPRHPKPNSSTNGARRSGWRHQDDTLGYQRTRPRRLRDSGVKTECCDGGAATLPLAALGNAASGPSPTLETSGPDHQQVWCSKFTVPRYVADAFMGGTLHRRRLTAGLFSFPLTGKL